MKEKALRPKNSRRKNRTYIRLIYGSRHTESGTHIRVTTSLARIVWMIHHKQLIPADHEVHHIDGDRDNNSVLNLEILHKEDHRLHHHPTEDTRTAFT